MKGKIGFKNLVVQCLIGINPNEQDHEQELLIDLKIESDFTHSANSDSIIDTISYDDLAQICTEIAKSKRHHLMETLANHILQRITTDFNIAWAWIRIKKPKALKDAQHAFVELEWEKK